MSIVSTPQFIRDVKQLKKKHWPIEKLNRIVGRLAAGETLPPSCHDHSLSGNHSGERECHIEPNWLLVYRIDGNKVVLVPMRTGTHDEVL